VMTFGGLGRLTPEEYQALERLQANLDRNIKPRLGPKRRLAPRNGWNAWTPPDFRRLGDAIRQAFNS
jgi:hypothetical protein